MSADPLADAPTVLVAAVGRAEGSRAAAAALACAGADVDRAALLVDMGGRAPRPTLLASAAAHRLEERLAAHLPQARVAARGQVCHLAVAADPEGLAMASAAVTAARGLLAVVQTPPSLLPPALASGSGPRASGVLLRADLDVDRALTALVVRDLIARGLSAAVLKQRLSWVAERRALFGALAPEAVGGLPAWILSSLATSHECYAPTHDPGADPTRAAQPERRDHASTGSR
ncbi:MAG TPA: hypothetical protein VHU86_02975 [Solirubrobacterales bacterium]|nr:hypothetical protein [Solirubrobacterales bacterium]